MTRDTEARSLVPVLLVWDAAVRTDEARQQYELLAAQQRLYATQGRTDDQVAVLIKADHGEAAEALRPAELGGGA